MDAKKIDSRGIRGKMEELIEILEQNPFQSPPPFERLSGELEGNCSRRINIRHRLVYSVKRLAQTVRIFRMWTYYE